MNKGRKELNGAATDSQSIVPSPESAIVGLNGDDFIKSRIFMVRGIQIMLDRDLAALYGVTTGALNQAVKRNKSRFPERFMFQMSKDEVENLKSQSVISSFSASTGTEILKSQL